MCDFDFWCVFEASKIFSLWGGMGELIGKVTKRWARVHGQKKAACIKQSSPERGGCLRVANIPRFRDQHTLSARFPQLGTETETIVYKINVGVAQSLSRRTMSPMQCPIGDMINSYIPRLVS